MLGGTVKRTEEAYRALECDSSSSLALFVESRGKYYKKYFLDEEEPFGEEEEEKVKEKRSMAIGSLAHTMILNPEDFDEKYYMGICQDKPTGLMAGFVDNLLRLTEKCTNEDDVITRDFEDLMKEAYSLSAFKRDKFDTVAKKFIGTEVENYYTDCRYGKGKTVVTEADRHIVDKIKNSAFNYAPTARILELEESDRYSIFNELQGEGLKINGLELKFMLDKIIVDHEAEIIYPYDLKVTWDVERFYRGYYLKRKSYFQTLIYTTALRTQVANLGFDYSKYWVEPIKYIALDTVGFSNPIIYETTEEDLVKAYGGFEDNGYYYPGVKETIDNLIWAKENNEWKSSRETYLKGGILPLK